MDAREIRRALASDWYRTLARRSGGGGGSGAGGVLNSISGATPPSTFVGSYGYPKVMVGPAVPPVHGNTSICDRPEEWAGLRLGEIAQMRLGMVRGVRQVRVDAANPDRYVCSLQEVAMSSRPLESDVEFDGAVRGLAPMVRMAAGGGAAAGHAFRSCDVRTPYGPVGVVKSAKFSGMGAPSRQLQNMYYDTDVTASDAIFSLYGSGVAMSDIQRCLSMGMLGQKRRLVPTKWGITAADSVVSSRLLAGVACNGIVDSYRVFWHAHFGNVFAVVLFPRRWFFELTEGWWHLRGGHAGASVSDASAQGAAAGAERAVGFGSDWETGRRRRSSDNTAGAYYAAQLAVLEYLAEKGLQAGVLVIREITPEYSMPVGVWQIREGVRAAMRGGFEVADGAENAIARAASHTSIGAAEWIGHGRAQELAAQRRLSEYA